MKGPLVIKKKQKTLDFIGKFIMINESPERLNTLVILTNSQTYKESAHG